MHSKSPAVMNLTVMVFLLLALTCQPAHTNALRIRFPHTIRGAKGEAHANTCQCECCYNYDNQKHSECISSAYTMFDVAQCIDCTVAACAEKFPISCDEPTSVVNTSCIVRKGWLLRLLPIAFIIVSIGLLVYGIFFKKFDGYNPVSHSEPVRLRLHHQDYYSTASSTPRTPALPPISESQELVEPGQTPR